HRDNAREKQQLFTCEAPEDVVKFLEDNYNVPSMYEVPPLPPGVPARERVWNPARQDRLLGPDNRFPVLPPSRDNPYDDRALTSESELRDSTDGHAVSQAWYAYAQ